MSNAHTADVQAAQAGTEFDARARRRSLLSESDWTQLPDAALGDTQKLSWKTYRQALRDITKQAGFPDNIQWPVQPE